MVECGELVRNKEKMTFRFRRLGCRRSIGIYMDDRPFSRWCPLVLLGGVKEGRKGVGEQCVKVSMCRWAMESLFAHSECSLVDVAI